MFCRILLGLAITAKIAGTLSMRWISVNHGNSGFTLMLVIIALPCTFLSSVVRKIVLGVTYALWEGIGILFITLFNVLLFDEALSTMKVTGLASLVLSIVLIKPSTRKPAKASKEVTHAIV